MVDFTLEPIDGPIEFKQAGKGGKALPTGGYSLEPITDGVTFVKAPPSGNSGGWFGDKVSDKSLSELITGQKTPDRYHARARAFLDANPQFSGGYADRLLHGLSLGYGDEAVAGLHAGLATALGRNPQGMGLSERYAYEKALQDERNADAKLNTGKLGTALDIAGSLAPTTAVMKGVGAVANAGRALPLAGRLMASPLAQSVTGGAVTGATEAYGNGENVGTGAALGAAGGLAGEALAKTLGYGARRLFDKAPDLPTTQDLFDTAKDAYKRFEASPGRVTPEGTRQLSDRLATMLNSPKVAHDAGLFPKVEAAANAIGRYDGELPATSIQRFRQLADNAAGSIDGGERRIGKLMKNEIDDWATNLRPDQMTGPIDTAALAEANKAYATASKAKRLDDFIDKATRSASVTGRSGESALRRAADKLLNKPRGLTGDELTAARAVVDGGTVQNAARSLSDYVGFHSPWALASHAAAFPVTGGATLPLGVAAELAKLASKRTTRTRLDNLSRLIRAGGDANALRATPSRITGLLDANRQALAAAPIAGLLSN